MFLYCKGNDCSVYYACFRIGSEVLRTRSVDVID